MFVVRAVLASLLTFGATAAGCGVGSISPPPETSGQDDTTLGPGDRFDVRVYGEADLTSNYQVAQDGSIDFPYIGRVQVATLEPTEISDMIETRLREGRVLVSPQV